MFLGSILSFLVNIVSDVSKSKEKLQYHLLFTLMFHTAAKGILSDLCHNDVLLLKI